MSRATIRTEKSQTRIRIWSALEVAAMGMLRDMAGEVVEIVTEKEEAENVRACMKWLEVK